MTFARDTAVSPRGPGRFATTIVPGWDIGGNANGGYLLALVARAMVEACGRADPVTVTAHYLAPGKPGPAAIETEVVREGKRFATVSASLSDTAGRRLLQVLGTFGDLIPSPGPERLDVPAPELPPCEVCVAFDPERAGAPAFQARVDLRLHPADAGFFQGAPTGQARVRGWFRLRDGEPLDSLGLLLATDAFPPTIFNTHLPIAWTPTIELTAHVRARPAAGWLRCSFRTRFVTGGFLEEDGELWDSSGRLVAQSRQLALVPRQADPV